MLFQGKTGRLMILGLLFGVGVILGIVVSIPDSRLHIIACDVGQGDAILVSLGSTQVLIDGGPDRRVTDCLSRYIPFWDKTIEMVVLTHPQADHLNGLVDVIEQYEVEKIVVNGLLNDTAGFRALRDAVIAQGASVHLPSRGDEIRLDPIRMTILWPVERMGVEHVWKVSQIESEVLGAVSYSGDLNETSIVLSLAYGEFDALLVGDIGFSAEEALMADGALTEVEVLKVGHHGSKYSSSLDFLREVVPQLAIISVGEKNRFGHPTSDTLMRLGTVGARVLRTDLEGDIEVVSDGKRYWVVQ